MPIIPLLHMHIICRPTPNLENNIRCCHGYHTFSLSPYQISFKENFVSHSEGPTEQFGMNLKGPRSAE